MEQVRASNGVGAGAGRAVTPPGNDGGMETRPLTPEALFAVGDAFVELPVEGFGEVERGTWLTAVGRHRSQTEALLARLVSAKQPIGLVGAAERSAELVRASGVSQREARRSVRMAEALAEAPAMAAALAAGVVTPGHAEALAYGVDRLDRAVADADPGLQSAARELPADGFRTVVDEWQRDRWGDVDGRRLAQRQHRRRRAGWRTLADGMVRIEADLAPDAGAVVVGELGRIAEDLWRHEDGRAGEPRSNDSGGSGKDPKGESRSVVQRNADAFAEMARRSSAREAVGMGSGASVRARADIVCVVDYAWIVQKLHKLPQSAPGINGNTELRLPPPADVLPVVLPAMRRCETDDGIQLTATQLRRLACDARVLPVVMGGGGQILDLGRSNRTVSPAQRTGLIARDGGCIFPGCDRPASWCDAHHIIHWLDSGPTDLWNLCLLCSAHHHIVHDGGWTLRHLDPLSEQGIGNGRIGFTDPRGRTHEPDRRTRRTTAA